MIFFGLGIALGWDNDKAMERSATSSAGILAIYLAVSIGGVVTDHYLNPFKSATCVLGANILFLAMLIMSSKYHRSGTRRYFNTNLMMLVLLLLVLGIGSVHSMDGLKNTSIVYLILWSIEKYHEYYFNLTSNGWGFIFSMSALVYYLALWLNMHPEFVVSLFKAN